MIEISHLDFHQNLAHHISWRFVFVRFKHIPLTDRETVRGENATHFFYFDQFDQFYLYIYQQFLSQFTVQLKFQLLFYLTL